MKKNVLFIQGGGKGAYNVPKTTPIFFYHSRDDTVVPFAHLAMYTAKLPQAVIHEFDDRGHQFRDDLSEVARDILRTYP